MSPSINRGNATHSSPLSSAASHARISPQTTSWLIFDQVVRLGHHQRSQSIPIPSILSFGKSTRAETSAALDDTSQPCRSNARGLRWIGGKQPPDKEGRTQAVLFEAIQRKP